MIEKLLEEISKNSLTFPSEINPSIIVIEVNLVKELIKKHITKENCEKWLSEELSKNKNQTS